MHRWTWGLATAACVILSQPAAQVAEGGWCDWMFGREPERPAVAYYAPATTTAPCCPPTIAYSVPTTTSAAPATCGSAPMVYRAPQTVAPATARINPIPQTYYRTTYKQIPVTVYRPIAGTDVVTGYPLTINRPCTTQEWRVQRVPTGIFGSGRFPGVHGTVPMATSAGPSCCNAATTMPAAPPYYTPPAGGMAIPPTAPPMTPGMSLPPTTPTSPPPTMTPGTGVPPAEQRPTLSYNSGATSSTQLSGITPQVMATKPATSVPATAAPMTPIPPRANNLQLRPVPDPDAPPQTPTNTDEVPQLLNPRDRMASAAPVRKDWEYAAINWPANHSSAGHPVRRTTATRDSSWDSSGWTTVPGK